MSSARWQCWRQGISRRRTRPSASQRRSRSTGSPLPRSCLAMWLAAFTKASRISPAVPSRVEGSSLRRRRRAWGSRPVRTSARSARAAPSRRRCGRLVRPAERRRGQLQHASSRPGQLRLLRGVRHRRRDGGRGPLHAPHARAAGGPLRGPPVLLSRVQRRRALQHRVVARPGPERRPRHRRHLRQLLSLHGRRPGLHGAERRLAEPPRQGQRQGCWTAKNSWSTGWGEGVWAYGAVRGWLKLDSATVTTNEAMLLELAAAKAGADRKSTRLNSSHVEISYAVFCLKKKK